MVTKYPDVPLADFNAAVDQMNIRSKDGPQGETHWDYRGRSTIMSIHAVDGWIVAEMIEELCARLGVDVDRFYSLTAASPDEGESEE